ncbi:MAG: hypothetical protein KAI27_04670, partial [Rhodospirillaceae bacterium]|nr:hypothetical protein [Rhodospirillaceae bacterium]
MNTLIATRWIADISDPELAKYFDETDTDETLTLSIILIISNTGMASRTGYRWAPRQLLDSPQETGIIISLR